MIVISFLLITFFTNCAEGKSYIEQQGITEYEVVHFNLNDLESSNIIQFTFNGQDYKVQLERNDNISPIINIKYSEIDQICHYHGSVVNYDHKSMVSLSLCDNHGIRGSIRAFGQEIWIYPSKYALSENNNGMVYDITDEHVIYAQSGVKIHPQPQALYTRGRLQVLYNDGDNVVEVYLLTDKTLVDHFKAEAPNHWFDVMFTFLADVINTADGYYRGTNWGNDIGNISIKWVALDVVEEYNGIFADITNWQNSTFIEYLKEFVTWYGINKDEDDFDYAMIFGSQPNFDNNGNIGYSYVDAMCDDDRKAGMISNVADEFFNVRDMAELFAHELGHSLGHDNDAVCNNFVIGPNMDIMRSNIGENGFSPCSISFILAEFADDDQDGFPCLEKS